MLSGMMTARTNIIVGDASSTLNEDKPYILLLAFFAFAACTPSRPSAALAELRHAYGKKGGVAHFAAQGGNVEGSTVAEVLNPGPESRSS
jgi:hypothetical protein